MNRKTSSLLYAFVSLLNFALSVLLYLFSRHFDRNTLYQLIKISPSKLYIPLIVYMFLASLIVGFIIVATVQFVFHRYYSEIDQKLTALNNDQYQSELLKDQNNNPQLVLIDHDISNLEKKLVSLQQELQKFSSQSQTINQETKESILTEERHRLARELHDSVSQQLFASMMMLSALSSVLSQRPEDDQVTKTIKTLENVINEAQSEMRALLLHLRPVNLEGKSLREGTVSLLKELQSKIQIQIHEDLDNVVLPSGIEDNLFRILQEVLSNTLRHAKAKDVDVYLKENDNMVILKVVDDGVGYDMKSPVNQGSYGLRNIQERANSIGATLKIISFPNQGTSVEIRIPKVKRG